MKNIAVDNINKIAQWFLHVKPMTHKSLQKLLYFSYGIYMVQNNPDKENITNILFENKFEAWVHGPVDPEIYEIYKYNGINLMSKEEPIVVNFSEEVLKALNTTIDIYGSYDADQLEDISHHQTPWIKAREGLKSSEPSDHRLDDKEIFETFYEIING